MSKDAQWKDESIDTIHGPIGVYIDGHFPEKLVGGVGKKIVKNRRKILRTSTPPQKMRIDETSPMVYHNKYFKVVFP